MKPDSLVQLVAGGNTRTVEDEWMQLIESPDVSLSELAEYGAVLAELKRIDQVAQAEAFAWATIETLSARYSALDILTVAGPFLLALGESEDLRDQVTGLYKTAYADREGFSILLKVAGIAGRRPIRRALRTLDVCLAVSEGSFLSARDGDGAARVDKIDRTNWRFTVTANDRTETLGAIDLADRYHPATATDFRVMRWFARDRLASQLTNDPAPIAIAICKLHGNKMDRDTLEVYLVPDLMSEEDWKKWWPRARAALKRHPNVQIERRAPYAITYTDKEVKPEDILLAEFEKLREPLEQFDAVERCVRDCNARNESPSRDALTKCYESFCERAERLSNQGVATAGLVWMIARRVGEVGGIEGAAERGVALFKSAGDLASIFDPIENDLLHDLACDTLVKARPDEWQVRLIALLPTVPTTACDRMAARLVEAGLTLPDFEPVIEKIMASPVECFEALLWLWDGPSVQEHIPEQSPVTILSRILRALDDSHRDDALPKERVKKLGHRARAVLAARKYERFLQCLEVMEPGIAATFRRQISRQDSLGRTVRADLLRHISDRFPALEAKPQVPPWQRDDVLYVTEAGLTRKQREIDHHVNVKMKENARAIGRAAEHGDLSENAEYKFALEERDLLRARLALMNAEMAMAEVIGPADVPADHVGIGTRAVFKRVTDGQTYEMGFVGAWEADHAKGWFNYKTPIAQKVLGARVGDVVEFEHSGATGQYEIVSVHNSLAEQKGDEADTD